MSDIVLKDMNGDDNTYEGVTAVKLNLEDGSTKVFVPEGEGGSLIDYVNNGFYCKTAVSKQYCNLTGVRSVTFMYLQTIAGLCFDGCSDLEKADFHAATSFGTQVFSRCYKLRALVIRTETMCTLSNSDIDFFFSGIPYIYVPSSLVETYKADSAWSNFSSYFRAIEDYPDICG